MSKVCSIHNLNYPDDSEHKFIATGGDGIVQWKDAILMQSTGLKDADGKDIYEGDILSSKEYYSEHLAANHKKIGVVKYSDGYGDADDVGYYLEGKEFTDGKEWRTFRKDLIKARWGIDGNYNKKPLSNGGWIMGNIYENPELLNANC